MRSRACLWARCARGERERGDEKETEAGNKHSLAAAKKKGKATSEEK